MLQVGDGDLRCSQGRPGPSGGIRAPQALRCPQATAPCRCTPLGVALSEESPGCPGRARGEQHRPQHAPGLPCRGLHFPLGSTGRPLSYHAVPPFRRGRTPAPPAPPSETLPLHCQASSALNHHAPGLHTGDSQPWQPLIIPGPQLAPACHQYPVLPDLEQDPRGSQGTRAEQPHLSVLALLLCAGLYWGLTATAMLGDPACLCLHISAWVQAPCLSKATRSQPFLVQGQCY